MNERPTPKDKRVENHKENKRKAKELEKEAARRAIASYYGMTNPND